MNISFKDTLKSDGTSFFDTCFAIAEDYFDYTRDVFLNTHRKIKITHIKNSNQIESIHAIACEHFADKNAPITFGNICKITVWAVSLFTLVVPICLLITDLAMRHFKLKHYELTHYEIPTDLIKQISTDLNNIKLKKIHNYSPIQFYTNKITNERFCIFMCSDEKHLKKTLELQEKIQNIDKTFYVPVKKYIQIDGQFYSVFVYDEMQSLKAYTDQSSKPEIFKQLVDVALQKKYQVVNQGQGALTVDIKALWENNRFNDNYEVLFQLAESVSTSNQLTQIKNKAQSDKTIENQENINKLINNIDNKIKNINLSEFYEKQKITTKNEPLKITENYFSNPFQQKIAEAFIRDINNKISDNQDKPHSSNRKITASASNVQSIIYYNRQYLPENLKYDDSLPFCKQMIFDVLRKLQEDSIINAFTHSLNEEEFTIQA